MANTKITSQHINKIIGNLAISGGGGAGLVAGKGIGAPGTNINWTNNIFAELNETPHESIRKYEIYESTEDLLALSCAWYRLRQDAKVTNKPVPISKLINKQLFDIVNDTDRLHASSIRDYYSKKIMIWKLKNQHLTPFREDLNSFIHSDGLKFVEKTFGLAYRLPEFYAYDTTLDNIFTDKNKEIKKDIRGSESKKLQYIGKTLIDRRSMKRNEYWFSDENNNVSVILLGRDNPLLEMFEQVTQTTVTINGLYYTKQKDEKNYYQIEKYKLVL